MRHERSGWWSIVLQLSRCDMKQYVASLDLKLMCPACSGGSSFAVRRLVPVHSCHCPRGIQIHPWEALPLYCPKLQLSLSIHLSAHRPAADCLPEQVRMTIKALSMRSTSCAICWRAQSASISSLLAIPSSILACAVSMLLVRSCVSLSRKRLHVTASMSDGPSMHR